MEHTEPLGPNVTSLQNVSILIFHVIYINFFSAAQQPSHVNLIFDEVETLRFTSSGESVLEWEDGVERCRDHANLTFSELFPKYLNVRHGENASWPLRLARYFHMTQLSNNSSTRKKLLVHFVTRPSLTTEAISSLNAR